MGIRITGFEDVSARLRELRRAAERLGGTNNVPLSELLTSEFMLLHTDFQSVEEMLRESGFTIETEKDLDAVPLEVFDDFIRRRTRFASWREMLSRAAHDYVAKNF